MGQNNGTIETTKVGGITENAERLEHDIVIRLSGRGEEAEEAVEAVLRHLTQDFPGRGQHIFQKGAKRLIVGSGKYDNMRLSPEAKAKS